MIRGNLAQAAVINSITPRQLSFRSAVQLVYQTAKQLMVQAGNQLTCALLSVMKAIASTVIVQKRKNQPRAIKRRPKPFPLLIIPRHKACLNL